MSDAARRFAARCGLNLEMPGAVGAHGAIAGKSAETRQISASDTCPNPFEPSGALGAEREAAGNAEHDRPNCPKVGPEFGAVGVAGKRQANQTVEDTGPNGPSRPKAHAVALTADGVPLHHDTMPDAIVAWAEGAAAEALDGYQAPAPLADRPDSEHEHLHLGNQETADGYRRAALCRPPSWWRAEAHIPTPGVKCTCCDGRRWWTRDELGWCCATCHPPSHLPADATRTVHT
jgi:hypothetical protein